jgi:RNA polymerase sigma-70 factor (sigma-E family)
VPTEDDGFSDFVRSSSRALLRSAWLLTGDSTAAEDLVQASLAHTWVRWGQIRSRQAAEMYVRRVMMTTFLGWRRRRWTAEIASDPMPDVVVADDALDRSLVRDALLSAVRALPPHQRAVIALRYLDDQSEAATAEILGCSVGAVKSQASRAIKALRSVPGLQAAITGESV